MYQRDQQRGAVAIEFAIAFVLFFVVFYALVSYAMPMLVLQSFNMAASEGVRAAVAVEREQSDYQSAVRSAAMQRANNYLSWMPDSIKAQVNIRATFDDGLLHLQVSYDDYLSRPMLPVLNIPGFGNVPNLPNDLRAESSIQL